MKLRERTQGLRKRALLLSLHLCGQLQRWLSGRQACLLRRLLKEYSVDSKVRTRLRTTALAAPRSGPVQAHSYRWRLARQKLLAKD
jgi:hypothetical protein